MAVLRDIFRPSSPIDDRNMFKGRGEQLSQAISAISTPGQHCLVYGERGVGKTSLVYMTFATFDTVSHGLAVRVPCSMDDDFVKVWKKFVPRALRSLDLRPEQEQEQITPVLDQVEDLLNLDDATPESVARALHLLSSKVALLIAIDEFDRIGDLISTQLFSDLIKTLSDDMVPCTLMLVGVADDVDGLVQGHRSIERAMRQIHMPRMTSPELTEIVHSGFRQFTERTGYELKPSPSVVRSIVSMSQGFPYYTHLLALSVGELALRRGVNSIEREMVLEALFRALDEATQMIRVSYTDAVTASRSDASFTDTLLACALAPVDELGFFAPIDVAPALSSIAKQARTTANYSHHLKRFSGPPSWILETRGDGRRTRYRFHNPLMKPFVLMKGIRDGRLELPANDE